MKKKFLMLIDQEIKNHLAGKPAYIKIKINHVTDTQMVQKVYDAAMAGVKVDMLVRGNCALVDNDETKSNLKIKGIIDRYLEHARIYCFCNGGDEKIFLGSADWMTRNLDGRIEVVTPVYDPDIKEECRRVVEWGFNDTTNGRWVAGEEKYTEPTTPFRSQEALYSYYSNCQTTQSK